MSDKLARDLERYADLVEDCALISPEEMNCASVMRLSAEALLSKTVEHWSDCAVHSEPAYPKGECDCGGFSQDKLAMMVAMAALKELVAQVEGRFLSLKHDHFSMQDARVAIRRLDEALNKENP